MSTHDDFYAAQLAMTQASIKLAQANRELAQAEHALAAAQLSRFTSGNLQAPSYFSSTPLPANFAQPPASVFAHKVFAQQPVAVAQQQPVLAVPFPQEDEPEEAQQQQQQEQQVPAQQQQQQRRPNRKQQNTPYLQAAAAAPETPATAPTVVAPVVVPGIVPIAKVRSNAPPSNNKFKKDQASVDNNKPPPPTFFHYCAKIIKDELGDNIFSPSRRFTYAQVRDKGYCTFVEPIVLDGPRLFVCREFHTNGTFCNDHYEVNEQRKVDREQNQEDYAQRKAAREQRQAQYRERQEKRGQQQQGDGAEEQVDATMNRRDRRRGQVAGVQD